MTKILTIALLPLNLIPTFSNLKSLVILALISIALFEKEGLFSVSGTAVFIVASSLRSLSTKEEFLIAFTATIGFLSRNSNFSCGDVT
ncbi:MAG: hypothetical protein HC785_22200 [Calothrix sp. CSU_2_0]|nr:hypothetical protein [Calothrix sp. CSU_2_0]